MMRVVFGNQISNVCGLKPPHQLPPTLGCGFHHAHLGDYHDYDDDDDDDYDDVWIQKKKWEEWGNLFCLLLKEIFATDRKIGQVLPNQSANLGANFFEKRFPNIIAATCPFYHDHSLHILTFVKPRTGHFIVKKKFFLFSHISVQ